MAVWVEGLLSGHSVMAGDEACPPSQPVCFDYVVINQWACETCPGSIARLCTANPDPNNPCTDVPEDPVACGYDNPYCYDVCVVGGTVWSGGCEVLELNAECNTGPGYCGWIGALTNCQWSGGDCSEGSQIETRGCSC